jgi:hypothetical protein
MFDDLLDKIRLWANMVSCTFTHPKDFPKVYLPHLQNSLKDRIILEPMDVMLWHGHTPLNKAIQSLTDSALNHVSFFLGEKKKKDGFEPQIVHAIGEGVKIQDLRQAWELSDQYILVYRYKSAQGRRLSFTQRDGMIEALNKYIGKPYDVSALILLAKLAPDRDKAGFLMRGLLDEAYKLVHSLVASGTSSMICSELIYRGFQGAGIDLRILPELYHEEYRQSNSVIRQEILNIPPNDPPIEPDFVTPHDLAMSPDLEFIGQLVKEF